MPDDAARGARSAAVENVSSTIIYAYISGQALLNGASNQPNGSRWRAASPTVSTIFRLRHGVGSAVNEQQIKADNDAAAELSCASRPLTKG